MRINRLDLTRYGIFTDDSIAFGDRKTDAPDLHIIYGENEAGKSTALAAFLDLLFSIETRSPYGFLHPYATMRIGGELEINGAVREVVRVKRAQNSLLDGNDNPIAESAILADLGGIVRESYKTMFSLDDDTLEEGGESILASKGDLGQLLFSASAGLSDLSQKLVELKSEADGFYKFRARGGELSKLKAELAELKNERERIDTIASEYARLVEVRDRTGRQYDEAIAERGKTLARKEEIERQLRALPRLVELRRVRALIEPLAAIPDAPFGWAEELPALRREEIELATQADGVASDIETISEEIENIVVDERISGLAGSIDLLGDLRARYVTAEKDIPKLRLRLKEAKFGASRTLAQLERAPETKPADLLIGASTIGALRGLMEEWSGIEAARNAADEELAEARRHLEKAEAKLKAASSEIREEKETAGGIALLTSALALARASDHEARLRLARRSRQEHLETLAGQLRTLRPWTGEAKELTELSAPSSGDIERWKDKIATLENRVDRLDTEIEKLEGEQRRLTAEVEAIGEVEGVVSDQEAAKFRTAREEAWAVHKSTLDAKSAGAFEEALRRDDIVTNSRISNAADVANLNQTGKSLAMVKAELDAAGERRKSETKELEGVRQKMAAVIRAMSPSLPENLSLSELEKWLDQRNKALESSAAINKADRDITEAEEDGSETRRKLVEALRAIGKPIDDKARVDALILMAQETIDREGELKALRTDVADRQENVQIREKTAKKAESSKQAWEANWAEACSSCWLGEGGAIPVIATVREVLKALEELEPLVTETASLSDRIQKMEDDQCRFSKDVAELANALDLDATLSPLDLVARLTKAVEEARAAETARKGASTRLKDAESRKQEIVEKQTILKQRKAKMTDHFKVGSLDEVDTKLRDLEKRQEYQKQAETAENDIVDALDAPSVEAAEEVLDKIDRSAIEVEIAELNGRFEDQDGRSRELFSERSKALDSLDAVGGDDAVAKIEEQRRTILLEIEEGAERYLRLRLGIAAAEQALRIYRDQHRSSMMTRASDAFQTISRGAYKGLSTQPEKDSEVLIAVGAKGGSKVASELSKGTRFQLYLALRVAGYLEFAQSRPSAPFIADDIMETFDDFRAEEAFKLFAEMGKVGQVIYLTHHRHLCDIAKSVCPAVNIHELSPPIAVEATG